VTKKTEAWYRESFYTFLGTLDSEESIKQRIVDLLQRGVSPISVNTWLRCINAFLHWRDGEGAKCTPQCKHIHLPRLKEEQKVLGTFTPEQISRIVHWKPIGRPEARLYALVLTAIDTGLRIDELLCLTREDVNFENFSLLVHGKGNKQRLVPMSVELRKVLYRYLSQHQHPRVFCNGHGGKLNQRNLLRDFKVICGKLGITGVRCSFHTLRHSFAVNYLRAGGNLYYLQRILGHSSIITTERYLRSIGIEDLKAVHSGLSLLAK
jgi:site-specific recombinase XerD